MIVKDDNLPRSSWKLGKILRLITSRDAKIRSAEVQLAGNNIITRAINHLYLLELPEKVDELVKGVDETDIPVNDNSTSRQQNIVESKRDSRMQRQASICTREVIRHCLNDNFITNLFCFPQECQEE